MVIKLDKKQEILQAALRLFSEKGFNETSVQEIANEAHISKGGFYTYFSSKKGLMLEMIKEYHDKIIDQASQFQLLENASPWQQLASYIELEIRTLLEHQSFFYVVFKEFPPKADEQVTKWMDETQITITNNQLNIFRLIYGKEFESYYTDLIVIMQGLVKEYTFYVEINNRSIHAHELSEWIGHLIHSIVMHLQEKQPLLHEKTQSVEDIFKNLKKQIEVWPDENQKRKYEETLHLIQLEWQKTNKNKTLLEILFHYLKSENTLCFDILQLEQLILQEEI